MTTNHTTTWFVTRHTGAVQWAKQQNLHFDRIISHLQPADIQPGDSVIGTLPVHLAAQVCQQGGHYYHFSLDLPPEKRGIELTADELFQYAARIEEYKVEQIL